MIRVIGQLGLDGSGWQTGLNRAEVAAGRFSSGIKNSVGSRLAAAFSIGAVTAFSRKIIERAGELRDVADATRLNVEWMQRWEMAAKQTGGSLGDIKNFSLELEKSRQAAVDNPNGKEMQAFNKMGVSAQEVSTLPAQKLVEKLMEAFKDGANSDLVMSVQEVGGKAAKNLIGSFLEGIDNDTSVMSESSVDALDELGDAFDLFVNTLMADLAPALIAVINGVMAWYNSLKQAQVFFGAFVGNVLAGFGEFIAKMASGDFSGAFKALADSFKQGWDDAQSETLDEETRQNEVAEKRAAASAAKRDSRKKAETKDEEFKPKDKDKEKPKEKDIKPEEVKAETFAAKSDSLVGVGNFLGSGAGGVETIQRQQLQTQRASEKHLAVIANKIADKGGTLETP
jgi:hypothetical protein